VLAIAPDRGTVDSSKLRYRQKRDQRAESMYNLYSMTSSHATIRELAHATRDLTDTQLGMHSIVPKQTAAVVRVARDGVRELVSMRWGFPPPTSSEGSLVTSIRNPGSHWWRPGFGREQRCLVPMTSFCDRLGKPASPCWFALDETRPLFFVAGVWRLWIGRPGQNSLPANGDHLLYSFLTTEATASATQPKFTPVLLLDKAARDTWLNGSLEQALALQRRTPDGDLRVRVVAMGKRQDGPAAAKAA
jgi:putative SOS response-associated peptidase YedK